MRSTIVGPNPLFITIVGPNPLVILTKHKLQAALELPGHII